MTDEREIETQVVHRDGRVLMLFSVRNADGDLVSAATDNLNLTPVAAQNAAEMLTAMAFEADTQLKPVGETLKAAIVERHRDKLIPRISIMLHGARENKKLTDGQLALQIVDVVFSEIFS